jgi:hypothetical protein
MQDSISPHTINEIFIAGVTSFQMRVLSNASFRFLVCLDSMMDGTQRPAAVAAVHRRPCELPGQKLMSNVTFEVAVLKDISVDPRSRKFKLVVDERRSLSLWLSFPNRSPSS